MVSGTAAFSLRFSEASNLSQCVLDSCEVAHSLVPQYSAFSGDEDWMGTVLLEALPVHKTTRTRISRQG